MVADYIDLNISQLLTILNRKLNTWKNLPLSLISKVNLIKMKILPLFLYVLRNSQIWIPKSIFKSIDSVLLSFLWHGGTPRLKLAILQQPWGEGGLAVPNFFKYFLAGQLTVAHHWLAAPWDNASISLEAAGVWDHMRPSLSVQRFEIPLPTYLFYVVGYKGVVCGTGA